ncbi:hypothetical protein Nepgr_022876 [Nepenthes gracilis]|uniref:Uncharacterized protein n=1 Tax=Nepenthes gracilis TaxID=150966 RepID=A0AAD3T1T0_NEPGR|nr:hypothetical protein Nepgr_022876 [Nepenthes gracilis]
MGQHQRRWPALGLWKTNLVLAVGDVALSGCGWNVMNCGWMRSYAVTFDADFAPKVDADCFLLCKCFALLVLDFLVPGYSAAPGCSVWLLLVLKIGVGTALYVPEAGMAVQFFWNSAAVLLRGHVFGGPALLLLVPPLESTTTYAAACKCFYFLLSSMVLMLMLQFWLYFPRRGSVSGPVVVGRSKFRLMSLVVGSSGCVASF